MSHKDYKKHFLYMYITFDEYKIIIYINKSGFVNI